MSEGSGGVELTRAELDEFRARVDRLRANVESIVVGKSDVVELTVAAMIARGHVLIADVPGVGKTTLAQALARSIAGDFHRVQFTNDLLPSDVVGVSVFDARTSSFVFKPGPVFANVILADEINRTTPKTQSCLLEAMNDGQVSVDGQTHRLPEPFLVLATQNPLEFVGTFPLPESQLDRFLMRLRVGYPSADDERRLLAGGNPAEAVPRLAPVLATGDVAAMQRRVGSIRVAEPILTYVLALVDRTRHEPRLSLGVSPRGGMALLQAARALALVRGRGYVEPDDVKSLSVPVLAHRVVLSAHSGRASRGLDLEEAVVRDVVEQVPVPL